jgi:hypothetical protein
MLATSGVRVGVFQPMPVDELQDMEHFRERLQLKVKCCALNITMRSKIFVCAKCEWWYYMPVTGRFRCSSVNLGLGVFQMLDDPWKSASGTGAGSLMSKVIEEDEPKMNLVRELYSVVAISLSRFRFWSAPCRARHGVQLISS